MILTRVWRDKTGNGIITGTGNIIIWKDYFLYKHRPPFFPEK